MKNLKYVTSAIILLAALMTSSFGQAKTYVAKPYFMDSTATIHLDNNEILNSITLSTKICFGDFRYCRYSHTYGSEIITPIPITIYGIEIYSDTGRVYFIPQSENVSLTNSTLALTDLEYFGIISEIKIITSGPKNENWSTCSTCGYYSYVKHLDYQIHTSPEE